MHQVLVIQEAQDVLGEVDWQLPHKIHILSDPGESFTHGGEHQAGRIKRDKAGRARDAAAGVSRLRLILYGDVIRGEGAVLLRGQEGADGMRVRRGGGT